MKKDGEEEKILERSWGQNLMLCQIWCHVSLCIEKNKKNKTLTRLRGISATDISSIG